jgi:hypothetical protein
LFGLKNNFLKLCAATAVQILSAVEDIALNLLPPLPTALKIFLRRRR